jgi:hypothetical protein
MSRVAPQPGSQHPAAIAGIGPEPCQLQVADGFEEKADDEQHERRQVERRPSRGLRSANRLKQRHGDQPHQQALKQEDREQADPPEPFTVFFAHLLVAVILRFTATAPQNVGGEPQTPQRHQGECEHRTRSPTVAQRGIDPGRGNEAGPPEDVDDARVAARQAGQPNQHQQAESHGESRKPD